VRHVPSFVWGHVLSALLLGFFSGAFLGVKAVLTFSAMMAFSALISAALCWRWPGFGGRGWQLWLVGVVANPLFLTAAYFSYQERDCLIGAKTGWDCILSAAFPMAMGLCLIPPLIGLAVRWLASWGAGTVTK
jgi:hypothetical protein